VILLLLVAFVVAARGAAYAECATAPTAVTAQCACGGGTWTIYTSPAGTPDTSFSSCDAPPSGTSSLSTSWAGLPTSDTSVNGISGSVSNTDTLDIWHVYLNAGTILTPTCTLNLRRTIVAVCTDSGGSSCVGSSSCSTATPNPVTVLTAGMYYLRVTKTGVLATAQYTFTFSAGAVGTGDPHFTGYLGQKFEFRGVSDHVYQLYSDEVIAVNTRVSKWEGPVGMITPNSTVMTAHGFLFARHYIVMETTSVSTSNNALNLKSSYGPLSLADSTMQKLDECLTVYWKYPALLVVYRDYEIKATWNWRDYNKRWFLNIDVDIPEELMDGAPRGGLLGQTVSAAIPALEEALFEASSLTASDAKTNLWKEYDTLCLA